MLLASDVLGCYALAPDAAGEAVEAGVTPCGADLKRQPDHNSSDCSTQQQWVAPGTAEQPQWDALPPSPPPQPVAMMPWQGSHLLDYVHRCLDALSSMHTVCAFIRTRTKAAELACAIFRRVCLQYSNQEQAALARELFVAQALLAACLWIAIKFEATRPTTPDSHIMSRITGVPAAFLCHLERKVLAALGWNLMDAAREVGAVGCVDLSDGPAVQQQAQLAALAQTPVLFWPTALGSPPCNELGCLASEVALPPGLSALQNEHDISTGTVASCPPAKYARTDCARSALRGLCHG